MTQVFQGGTNPDIISLRSIKALILQLTACLDSGIELRKTTFLNILIDIGILFDNISSINNINHEKDIKEPSLIVKAESPSDILRESEAAQFLRIHVDTLRKLRKEARGPAVRKHGSRFYYTRQDLIEWHSKSTK